jgi:D-Tyr-tRNAtyr deacylase
MYNKFNEILGKELGKEVQEGVFGADMEVNLVNDGPVTILFDSKINQGKPD